MNDDVKLWIGWFVTLAVAFAGGAVSTYLGLLWAGGLA